jgi:hypothetical protein
MGSGGEGVGEAGEIVWVIVRGRGRCWVRKGRVKRDGGWGEKCMNG